MKGVAVGHANTDQVTEKTKKEKKKKKKKFTHAKPHLRKLRVTIIR